MTETEQTRQEIEEALGYLNHQAKRCFPVVGNSHWKTPWDKAHEHINSRLDEWEAAK